ncbi:MAG: CIA30 family protein [Planctomycetes bacterium]|nr:CIA30 family protein [Planctomycetota bacterium]
MTPTSLLLSAAAAVALPALALAADSRTLTAFDGKDSLRWQAVNDGVMGGRSQGDSARTKDGTLLFSGEISLENNGGFSSIRTREQDLQLGDYDGLEVRVRGDGRTYKLSLRTKDTSRWIAYWADFSTQENEWTTVRIPFSKWVPTTFGRKLKGPALKTSAINSVGFMLYDKQAGPFALEVASIVAYKGAGAPGAVAQGGAPTLVEAAQSAGNFSTLLAAAKAAGLVEALSGEGPLTVFAPSDAAFAKLPEGTVAHLLKPENKGALRTVLLQHVVAGDVGLPALLRAPRLTTLAGQRLQVASEAGALKLGEATVAAAELRCRNGVIHVVDRVLLPELRDLATVAVEAKTFSTLVAAAKAAGLVGALTGDEPLTVFAPTDAAFAKLPEGTVASLLRPENKDALKRILLHHVVQGRVYADAAAAAGQAPTLAGTELSFGYANGLQVSGVSIVAPDVAARNGVIHVIDAVLLPPAVAAPAPTVSEDPASKARAVIELAVDTGAPLFNDGNPAACSAVYELAATALLELEGELFPQDVRRQLRAALASSEAPSEKAWTLRRALDAAYAQVREGLKK